jgi:hypothetical protein
MLLRRLATVVLVALPVLFASGCRGGDPVKPKPFETPTSSTSSAPTQTSTPQAESAEAAIHEFVNEQNQMLATGQTRSFLALTLKCEYCDDLSERIHTMYVDGGVVHTKGWTVVDVEPPTRLSAGRVSVNMTIDSAPTKYSVRVGAPLKTLKGAKGLVKRLELQRVSTEWRVTYLAEVSS